MRCDVQQKLTMAQAVTPRPHNDKVAQWLSWRFFSWDSSQISQQWRVPFLHLFRTAIHIPSPEILVTVLGQWHKLALKRVEVLFCPMLPDFRKIIAFWKVIRSRPSDLLVRITCGWRRVWSIGRVILTGEETCPSATILDWTSQQVWYVFCEVWIQCSLIVRWPSRVEELRSSTPTERTVKW